MMHALVFLLALQESTLTFDYKNVEVEKATEVIATYAGVQIELAPQFRGRSITLKANNSTVPDVLDRIGRQLGGSSKMLGGKRFRIAPDWQHAILGKLEEKKAHGLAIDGMELRHVLEIVRTQCGVRAHATLDPKKRIALEADGVSYRTVLDRIAKAAGGAWELRYGIAYLATQKELADMPLLPPEIEKRPRLPLHFREKSIVDALIFLQAASKQPIQWPEKLPDRKVTVKAESVDLAQALALVLYPAGLTAEEKDGVIVVK